MSHSVEDVTLVDDCPNNGSKNPTADTSVLPNVDNEDPSPSVHSEDIPDRNILELADHSLNSFTLAATDPPPNAQTILRRRVPHLFQPKTKSARQYRNSLKLTNPPSTLRESELQGANDTQPPSSSCTSKDKSRYKVQRDSIDVNVVFARLDRQRKTLEASHRKNIEGWMALLMKEMDSNVKEREKIDLRHAKEMERLREEHAKDLEWLREKHAKELEEVRRECAMIKDVLFQFFKAS